MTNTATTTPFVIAVATLAGVDLTTKWWAVNALSNHPRELPGPIDLDLAYNTGTAFGMFAGLPTIVVSTATLIVIALVVHMWRTNRAPTAPTTLVTAGAVANVLDRLEGDGVVDMLHTGWWPTFNLADIYITLGVAWWIATSIRSTDEHELATLRKGEQTPA